MVALKTYNSLPNELKSLYGSESNRKYKVKDKLKNYIIKSPGIIYHYYNACSFC